MFVLLRHGLRATPKVPSEGMCAMTRVARHYPRSRRSSPAELSPMPAILPESGALPTLCFMARLRPFGRSAGSCSKEQAVLIRGDWVSWDSPSVRGIPLSLPEKTLTDRIQTSRSHSGHSAATVESAEQNSSNGPATRYPLHLRGLQGADRRSGCRFEGGARSCRCEPGT